ncbi:MAG: hypothetical protein AAF519_03380 [Bacteroidota bacterium]
MNLSFSLKVNTTGRSTFAAQAGGRECIQGVLNIVDFGLDRRHYLDPVHVARITGEQVTKADVTFNFNIAFCNYLHF